MSDMQKRRPLGVTILAVWALLGSGVMFVWATRLLTLPQTEFITPFEAMARLVVVPLGAYLIPVSTGVLALTLGALYLVISLLTFRVKKLAWLANVGLSLAAIGTVAFASSTYFYGYLQYGSYPGTLGQYTQETLVQTVALHSIYYAIIAARLYYLFRPNVRDFFNSKSLFVQKRTA